MCGQGGNQFLSLSKEKEEQAQEEEEQEEEAPSYSSSTTNHICARHKEKEKGKEKVGEEAITKEMVPSSNYAGMNNPSYVILRRNDGYTFAKFFGTNYDDYEWTILVPKTLVAN